MLADSVRHRLEFLGVLILALPFYLLPRRPAIFFGNVLGWCVAHFLPIRRQVVRENLSRAFPEKTPREIRTLTTRTYMHFGKVAAEFARQDRYTPVNLGQFVRTENRDILDQAIDQQQGVVLLLGHFGNWELFAYWLGVSGYTPHAIHRTQENPLVDGFISAKRKSAQLRMIPSSDSVRGMLSALDEGNLLMILADQDARGKGTFVDFFDIPSSTFRGAAVFAQRQQCPIILAFPILEQDGTYRFIFEELQYHINSSQESVQYILQQYMSRLQYYVKQYPEQYFWFHRRWKTQPIKKKNSSKSAAPGWIGAGAAS